MSQNSSISLYKYSQLERALKIERERKNSIFIITTLFSSDPGLRTVTWPIYKRGSIKKITNEIPVLFCIHFSPWSDLHFRCWPCHGDSGPGFWSRKVKPWLIWGRWWWCSWHSSNSHHTSKEWCCKSKIKGCSETQVWEVRGCIKGL